MLTIHQKKVNLLTRCTLKRDSTKELSVIRLQSKIIKIMKGVWGSLLLLVLDLMGLTVDPFYWPNLEPKLLQTMAEAQPLDLLLHDYRSINYISFSIPPNQSHQLKIDTCTKF